SNAPRSATPSPTNAPHVRRVSSPQVIPAADATTPTATDTPAPARAPTSAPTPTPSPTATPAPTWHTVGSYAGTGTQDVSFTGIQWRVTYTCTPAASAWYFQVSWGHA